MGCTFSYIFSDHLNTQLYMIKRNKSRLDKKLQMKGMVGEVKDVFAKAQRLPLVM